MTNKSDTVNVPRELAETFSKPEQFHVCVYSHARSLAREGNLIKAKDFFEAALLTCYDIRSRVFIISEAGKFAELQTWAREQLELHVRSAEQAEDDIALRDYMAVVEVAEGILTDLETDELVKKARALAVSCEDYLAIENAIREANGTVLNRWQEWCDSYRECDNPECECHDSGRNRYNLPADCQSLDDYFQYNMSGTTKEAERVEERFNAEDRENS